MHQRIVQRVMISVFLCGSLGSGCLFAAEMRPWQFDCGTADSPVMAGYARLTASEQYDPGRGYGWETPAARGLVFPEPTPNPEWRGSWGQAAMLAYITQECRNNLNMDGVVCEGDLKFRMDVPNGRYRVRVTIGDMSRALGSIDVSYNDRLAGSHVAVWSASSYRMFDQTPGPWWKTIRKTLDVTDGTVRIALSKNQSYYDQQLAVQKAEKTPYAQWYHATPIVQTPPYVFIGCPFVHNSIMAIEVVPDAPAPVVGDNDSDRIRLTRRIDSPALGDAVEKYNRREFDAALKALEGVNETDAQVAKALVELWVAGRCETEVEREVVPRALATLKTYLSENPQETGVAEVVADAEIYLKAWNLHWTRGELGKTHFLENDKAICWWLLIGEDSPLYFKSQLHLTRAARMLKPYFPCIATEAALFRKLQEKFPDNRFIKYHLTQQWEPKGNGSDYFDWVMVDYQSLAGEAPEWVKAVYPAYAGLVDLSEWWVTYRQQPEGTIGGGWGDDVEMVGLFGYYGYVSRNASPRCLHGARQLVDGVWTLSEVDPERGFCAPMADAEHSAEWTGNTLGMMMQIDYGNPLWVERSMKTGKLIRDLWTGINEKGQRHFKANFLGASQIGSGDQANDSWINYRAVRPATAVLQYNANPTILKLYRELADAWVADALSTDRGKPKGIIPAQVAWPDGRLGGTNSAQWWAASHSPGTVNYDWWDDKTNTGQAYKGLLVTILSTVYDTTGDAKYFEPLRLEYELASKHGFQPDTATRRGGKKQWNPDDLGFNADPGSELWTAARIQETGAWLEADRKIRGRQGGLQLTRTTEEIVEKGGNAAKYLRQYWPISTTEAGPTDRVGFAGIIDPFAIYTGGGLGGPLLYAAFTYEDTTKHFAAAVLGHDPQGARILYYSLAPEEREIGLLPWELEPGGKYAVKYGIDSNGDLQVDETAETRVVDFGQRGQSIRFKIKPRMTYVIDIDQTERGRPAGLYPDPAICAEDIGYEEQGGILSVRVHNIGSREINNLSVEFYQGDPEAGGSRLGSRTIGSLTAPIDLEPRTENVTLPYRIAGAPQEIYVVLDAANSIADEITTANNVAHQSLPKPAAKQIEKKKVAAPVGRGRR
jgi:hypothetical protein